MACWNAGRATIEGADIPKNDPLLIEVKGQVVYDCEVIHVAQKASNARIIWEKVVILFIYYLIIWIMAKDV